jgi:hypothetical protein
MSHGSSPFVVLDPGLVPLVHATETASFEGFSRCS